MKMLRLRGTHSFQPRSVEVSEELPRMLKGLTGTQPILGSEGTFGSSG